MAWTYGTAVRTGAIHGPAGEGQDFAHCELLPDGTLLAVIADGAGTAALGAAGAKLACEAFAAGIREEFSRTGTVSRAEMAAGLAASAAALRAEARSASQPLAEFSTTLGAVAAGSRDAYFAHIGDGAAAYRLGADFRVATWPDNSEYANETVFLTSRGALRRARIRRVAGQISEVALFTDGLQYLVLDYRARMPHQRFFHSVAEQLEQGPPGRSETFSQWLEALLAAPQVTSRTDDDTSLVFARRIEEAPSC